MIPSPDASSTANPNHGASTTRSVRRDIHATAASPIARRPTTVTTPAAQIASRTIVNETGGVPFTSGAATAALGAGAEV